MVSGCGHRDLECLVLDRVLTLGEHGNSWLTVAVRLVSVVVVVVGSRAVGHPCAAAVGGCCCGLICACCRTAQIEHSIQLDALVEQAQVQHDVLKPPQSTIQ